MAPDRVAVASAVGSRSEAVDALQREAGLASSTDLTFVLLELRFEEVDFLAKRADFGMERRQDGDGVERTFKLFVDEFLDEMATLFDRDVSLFDDFFEIFFRFVARVRDRAHAGFDGT